MGDTAPIFWAIVVLLGMQALILGAVYLQVRRMGDQADELKDNLNQNLERLNDLLERIEDQRLVDRVSQLIDSGDATVSEVRDRVQQLSPTLAETEESVRHLRRVAQQLDEEDIPVKVSVLLDETNKLVMSLEETALKIDALVSEASDLREDIADRLTSTSDRIRGLVKMLKGIRKGFGKGFDVLTSPDEDSGEQKDGDS